MGKNSQSRKWILVINDTTGKGMMREELISKIELFSPIYYCLADEIADTGTLHTHIYLYAKSPVRFSTVKNRFPTAHIEQAYGTANQNRDYILKAAKWETSEKAQTSVSGSFVEWGDLPDAEDEHASDESLLIKSLREGKSITDILQEFPKFVFRVRDIEALRQVLLNEKFAIQNRDLEVVYLYGASGTGKTRSIFANHPANEICRITNYRKGVSFDAYSGQPVLVFEEFHSQIPIGEMLNYLDIYPLTLPARYYDRTACYNKVYITSNINFTAQYSEERRMWPEVIKALERRIHRVIEFQSDGTTVERTY